MAPVTSAVLIWFCPPMGASFCQTGSTHIPTTEAKPAEQVPQAVWDFPTQV